MSSVGTDPIHSRVHRGLVGTRLGPEADCEAVPAIDRDDGEGQICQFTVRELRVRFLIHVIRRMCLADPRQRFGPR